ncbi:MAG: ABC transporter permease [Sphaerochaetaceae bacterium]|nr:ABC transporter permease [Sphaerochaetaceae bacterium]
MQLLTQELESNQIGKNKRLMKMLQQMRRIWKEFPVISILVLFFGLVLPSLIPDIIAPHDPITGMVADRLLPPVLFGGTWKYPLGTDQLGRDIFSRIVHGASVSLSVSLTGIFIGGIVGTILGMMAGYYKGWVDAVIMRIVETTMSIPLLLLGLFFAMTLGAGFKSIIFVIIIVVWAYYARQIRGEVLSLRERGFIDRARVSGASNTRILFRHIFPNIVNTLIVLATLQVATVIIMEATLSFLGLGLPRPYPAWGLMVADGRTLIISAWWIAFFPGMSIMLVVLALNSFGDWLRDRLDPKLRQI